MDFFHYTNTKHSIKKCYFCTLIKKNYANCRNITSNTKIRKIVEQTLEIEKPIRKIYRNNAIWIGTFLGGPLAAGYLIAENFRAFNEPDKVKKTWIYTILATVVIFGVAFLIPENIKFPNQIIPFFYTAIAYVLVEYFQKQNIETYVNNGGELFGWGRTIVVGIIGSAITVIIILSAVFLFDSIDNASLTAKNYGTMKHEIVFDKSNITETEVDKLADGFIKTTFFDELGTKHIYAKKINNTYELSIYVIDGKINSEEILQSFAYLRDVMQSLFPSNKIVFKLVVGSLDNVVKIIE